MEHTLVLLGRFPGKDRAVALALARDFGRDEAWAMQIIGAAPIILLEGMTSEQANNICNALVDVENAGSRLDVHDHVDSNLPKLSWPAPPRIKGKLVSEFAGAASAAPAGNAGTGGTVSLLVPCPYTGQKMKLTLTINLSRVGDQITAGVAASATPVAQLATPASAGAAAPIMIPVPASRSPQSSAANAAYRPIPTPVVTPAAKMPPRPAAPAPARSTPNV